MQTFSFNGKLEKHENHLYAYHVKIPHEMAQTIRKLKIPRLMCSLNGGEAFHASLIPEGDNHYFIKVNQQLRKRSSLEIGSDVLVQLTEDQSKYGLPIPEEFTEILNQDPEGERLFHNLTPGKQRSLLYIIGKPKSSDKKIEKGIIVINHLKEQQGKLDFKQLHEDLKSRK